MTNRDDDKMDAMDRVVGWIDDEGDLPDDASSPNVDSDESVAEQLLINSLLQGHFESADDRAARIQSVLDRFDEKTDTAPRAPATPPRKPMFAFRKPQAVASLAAILLVAATVWILSTPQSAEAAIQRVIESVDAHVVRVYKADVKGRWLGIQRELNCTLRSCGSEKFVVEMHDTRTQPNAMGSDGKQRWTVAGKRTWKSSEGTYDLRDILIDRMTLTNLQINRLITHLPDNYELELLEATPLPGDESEQCRPIQATRIGNDTMLPDLVRVWAHPRTSVVARMEIIRERGKGKTPTQIDLQLVDEEPVDEEIFRPEHYERN